MTTWKTMKSLTTGMIALFGAVIVMGNTAPTCVPLEPEMQVICLSDQECANLIPDVDCVGDWACEDGECVFHCDDGPEPPISECTWDGDCGPNQHCEIVDCWAPPCDEGLPCPLMCMPIGECVDDDEPEELCYSTEECDKGQICSVELGDCLPMPGCDGDEMGCPAVCLGICLDLPTPECVDDSDCPEGYVCEGLIGPFPYGCEPGDDCLPYDLGQCVPAEIEGECAQDADCGPDAHCEIEEICAVTCFCDGPDCPEDDPGGSECFLYGTCVPDKPYPGECMSDEDCLPGQICELIDLPCYDCDPDDDYCGGACPPYGICMDVEPPPPGECMSDADCGPDQICELVDCYWDCAEDEYCGGMDCAPYGFCVDIPEPPDPCMVTGCSGQLCSDHDIGTTCEWLPHYVCFQDAQCGPNGPNGQCAWQHTDKLSACLALYLNAP